MTFSRRSLVHSLLASAAAAPLLSAGALGQPAPATRFRYADVVRRAQELSNGPYNPRTAQLPDVLKNMGFDEYRSIRFRPEKALFGADAPFRLHLFHVGYLFQQPVTVNEIRGGVAAPVPYQRDLFDLGGVKMANNPSINLGFAGFRLHTPLNDPKVHDEVISFLGASYFRFLGAGQKYGLSARGLAIDIHADEPEEFPHFREFWIQTPDKNDDRAIVFALLDSPSTTGAYRFEIAPGRETSIDVQATIFPRERLENVGLAPLTSMYFEGENDPKPTDDYRRELHDSDGLLMRTGAGEWLWRPLRNPEALTLSSFLDKNPGGFGLLQRDRTFENYQDLEARYHERPGYWVEPVGEWGAGAVELLELPTPDETHDNIVAAWRPAKPYEKGEQVAFAYRLRALGRDDMHPGGRVVNTFQVPARASGSNDPADMTHRRFLIDFAGGRLPFHLRAPEDVAVIVTTSEGEVTHTSVIPNDATKGFRAAFDIQLQPGQSTDLRAFLRAGDRVLTETWTYPWSAA